MDAKLEIRNLKFQFRNPKTRQHDSTKRRRQGAPDCGSRNIVLAPKERLDPGQVDVEAVVGSSVTYGTPLVTYSPSVSFRCGRS